LSRLMALGGGWRIGLAACWRRIASSSLRCSVVRFGFMSSLRQLRDVVGGDWANDERIDQVQDLEHDDDEPARIRRAKGDRTARRVARVERRVFVEQRGLNLCRR